MTDSYTGTINFYEPKKEYGFIEIESLNHKKTHIFFHKKHVNKSTNVNYLSKYDKVSFEFGHDELGRTQAINVNLLEKHNPHRIKFCDNPNVGGN